MKKNVLQSVKIIMFGLILGFGISIVSAQWTPPAGLPSNVTNTPAPINVSSTAQVKDGGLSVGAFLATMNAQFNGDIILNNLTPTSDNTPLCVGSDKKIKVCGISILNATWGQTVYSPPPHANYRIIANITGGTPPYSCTWNPSNLNPGQGASSCWNDVGIIPPTGLTISVSIHDSSTPQQTKTVSGQFFPGS